jgi:hypothetical protein
VGALWGPLLFGIGNTILQVIFCLGEFAFIAIDESIWINEHTRFFEGIIWRMDPFLMPHGFCVGASHAMSLMINFSLNP